MAALRQPDEDDVAPDPEERVTRGMELMEDLMKRIQTCIKAEETREQLFPPEGKKMSKVTCVKKSKIKCQRSKQKSQFDIVKDQKENVKGQNKNVKGKKDNVKGQKDNVKGQKEELDHDVMMSGRKGVLG